MPSVDMDSWPTQSLDGDDLVAMGEEQTRTAAPAYVTESARPPPAVLSGGPDVPLRMSQAMRVVVWSAPDGVHVAPAGTKVAAITVEALLVAVDPSADLAAWFRGK
jgi:hypothetical protein